MLYQMLLIFFFKMNYEEICCNDCYALSFTIDDCDEIKEYFLCFLYFINFLYLLLANCFIRRKYTYFSTIPYNFNGYCPELKVHLFKLKNLA